MYIGNTVTYQGMLLCVHRKHGDISGTLPDAVRHRFVRSVHYQLIKHCSDFLSFMIRYLDCAHISLLVPLPLHILITLNCRALLTSFLKRIFARALSVLMASTDRWLWINSLPVVSASFGRYVNPLSPLNSQYI